jgi:hypothetical protein
MNEPHPAVLGMIQGLKVDIKYQRCHFCLWPQADIAIAPANVRFWKKRKSHRLVAA